MIKSQDPREGKAKEYEKLELNKTNMKDFSGIVVLKYN